MALRYAQNVPVSPQESLDSLPLRSRTPPAWGENVLADPMALLIDHAFLEKKAATNALDMLTRWPDSWVPGWVETMTSIARDEAAHLAQVTRILIRRGGRLAHFHRNPYANELRQLVRRGVTSENIDRLFVSALIEARSCERFAVLAEAAADDAELAALYRALFSSELGHYKVFLKLAYKIGEKAALDARWNDMLALESTIIQAQEPGSRIHSGFRVI
jgi:tRNA-(ms[2]io[6]A)-hydroxylase